MSKRSKGKPKSPEAIMADRLLARARDLEAVNLPPEGAALASYADVQVSHAQRDQVDNARRADAFDCLKADMARKAPGAYDAVRRLERDMLIRAGQADPGRAMIRVDENEDGGGVLDRRLEAGAKVDAVLKLVGARDKWLLVELIERTVRVHILQDEGGAESGRIEGWRANVAYITGEENPVAQGTAVRCACANLSEAYKQLDEGARSKKRLAA
jgi:hypothetical protein